MDKSEELAVSPQREERTSVPPLSQSRQIDMACALAYKARHLRDIDVETEPARRGTEIHKIIAQYMDALSISKHPTDYDKMAQLSKGASQEALECLNRFTEEWFCDSDKIYDTELYISLDEEFNVVEARGKSERRTKHPDSVVHEGMLDLVIMESLREATIYDWKSYYQIVDADTFQSKYYPLLLFCLNPALEIINFNLTFVRYGTAMRSVTYKREDVPMLKKLAARERARLVDIHNRPDHYNAATPGKQCTWCPLLLTECPMKDVNVYSLKKPEEHVALALWIAAASKENLRVLKDWAGALGKVTYKDANGLEYVAMFKESETRSYPIAETVEVLRKYEEVDPKDAGFVAERLTVSGLSTLLKSKKRAALAEKMEKIVDIETGTRIKIGRENDPDEKPDFKAGSLFG